jgi:hypothetical protein
MKLKEWSIKSQHKKHVMERITWVFGLVVIPLSKKPYPSIRVWV